MGSFPPDGQHQATQPKFSSNFLGEWNIREELIRDKYLISKDCGLIKLKEDTQEYVKLREFLRPIEAIHQMKSIELVVNAATRRAFYYEIEKLEQRQTIPTFHKSDSELSPKRREALAHLETRNAFAVHNRDVKVIRAWHGTTVEKAHNILIGGFANLAILDNGWFGKGIYFSTYPEYAAQYCKDEQNPCLLFCYLALFKPYPIIYEDTYPELKFEGKANFTHYQCHYVPVVRYTQTGFRPPWREGMISGRFDEVVIFQESQILPFAMVPLDRTVHYELPYSPPPPLPNEWGVEQVIEFLHLSGIEPKLLQMGDKGEWKKIGIKKYGEVCLLTKFVTNLIVLHKKDEDHGQDKMDTK